jgi:ornithine--oxo-acid transaminase
MDTREYIAVEEQYNARNYLPLDVVLTRGEGVWVEDVEGQRYMDFLAAYSAVNQGHCHPRLVKAMVEQAARLTLTSRAFRNDQLPLLARELCELTGYEMMLPMNSGAEAVETLRGEGRSGRSGSHSGLPREFPWADDHHHQFLAHGAVQGWLWSFHPWL